MKEKVQNFFSNVNNAIGPYKKNLIIPLLKILAVIIICAILVRIMSGHETLSDYANKHPELAYPESSVEIEK